MFRSVIHSELIFMKVVSSVSRFLFFFFNVVASYSRTVCWKDCLCSIVLPLLLCQKSVDYIYVGLFLDSLFCWFVCLVFAITTLSWLLWLYSKIWSWVASVFQLYCSSPVLCWLFCIFSISIWNFESVCHCLQNNLIFKNWGCIEYIDPKIRDRDTEVLSDLSKVIYLDSVLESDKLILLVSPLKYTGQ